MGWYCCHVVEAFRARENRRLLGLYENLVLIEAANADAAIEKGWRVAQQRYGGTTNDSLVVDGVPAFAEVAGIRKTIEFGWLDGPSLDRAEATYSKLNVDNEDDLKRLVAGEPVRVLYEE